MTINSNSRILVTGADGFIGSHLVEALVKTGANVRALCMYNSFGDWGWLEQSEIRQEVEVVLGDVRDTHCCDRITSGVDIVFHLAALIAIPYSYKAPESYIDTNVFGTLNMVSAANRNGVGRFIHTSTSEVYGSAKYTPIDELHPLQPQSPYSASKIGADMVARSFYYSYNMPIVVARPFNTYGPRQSARAVIPTVISQILAKSDKISLGELTPTRDFNYVTDTCSGFLELAKCDACIGETINIGSKTEISIGETVNLIANLMGTRITVISDQTRIRPEKSEVQRLVCDNSKIKSLTNFNSSIPIEEGLQKTIEWFSRPENLKRYKTGLYNV